jgi:hypothetical protein
MMASIALMSQGIACNSKPAPGNDRQGAVEFWTVESGDLEGLKKWTELRCRGWSLRDLASSLNVDVTVDAVTDRLARNLPPKSRRVVIDACKRELEKTEDKGLVNSKTMMKAEMELA